jgi:hypothetical protein
MSEQNNVNQEEKRHLTSAERQKLYQQKATERRIEEYKKRKRAKMIKISMLVLAVLALIGAVVAVILLEKNVWEPARIYESAEELYKAEEYLDAYDVYISLGNYKDAATIAATCITKNAQKLAGRDDVIIGTSKSMPWFKIDEYGAISFDGDKYKGVTELTVPDVFDNTLVTAVRDKGFFYAKAESVAVDGTRKVVETFCQMKNLRVSACLTHLLDTSVDVSKVWIHLLYDLSVERDAQVKHTMGCRVLRTYVYDILVLTEKLRRFSDQITVFIECDGRAILHCLDGLVFQRNWVEFRIRVVVFSERETVPVCTQEETTEVWVTDKTNAEEVVCLSFK